MQAKLPSMMQKRALDTSAFFIASVLRLAQAKEMDGSSIVESEFVIVAGNNKNGMTMPVMMPYISILISALL